MGAVGDRTAGDQPQCAAPASRPAPPSCFRYTAVGRVYLRCSGQIGRLGMRRRPLRGLATAVRRQGRGRGGVAARDQGRAELCPAASAGDDAAAAFLPRPSAELAARGGRDRLR